MRKFAALFFSMIISIFAVSACGGRKADLERARHLIATGRSSAAAEAAEILKSLLEDAEGEEKLEVAELYSGALLSKAGFNGVSLIVNTIHRENNNVASTMRNVVEDVDTALDDIQTSVEILQNIVGTLHKEDGNFAPNLEPTVRDEVEAEYGFKRIEPDASYVQASVDRKKSMNYAMGISYLYRALYIILKITGFDQEDGFDFDNCIELLAGAELGKEGVDAISLSLFRARAYLARADYDDQRLGDAKNNKIISLVDDAQRGTGNTAIDRDRNGFVGEASEDAGAKSRLVCQYLEESL